MYNYIPLRRTFISAVVICSALVRLLLCILMLQQHMAPPSVASSSSGASGAMDSHDDQFSAEYGQVNLHVNCSVHAQDAIDKQDQKTMLKGDIKTKDLVARKQGIRWIAQTPLWLTGDDTRKRPGCASCSGAPS